MYFVMFFLLICGILFNFGHSYHYQHPTFYWPQNFPSGVDSFGPSHPVTYTHTYDISQPQINHGHTYDRQQPFTGHGSHTYQTGYTYDAHQPVTGHGTHTHQTGQPLTGHGSHTYEPSQPVTRYGSHTYEPSQPVTRYGSHTYEPSQPVTSHGNTYDAHQPVTGHGTHTYGGGQPGEHTDMQNHSWQTQWHKYGWMTPKGDYGAGQGQVGTFGSHVENSQENVSSNQERLPDRFPSFEQVPKLNENNNSQIAKTISKPEEEINDDIDDDSEPPPYYDDDDSEPPYHGDSSDDDDSESPAFTDDASNDDEEPPKFPGQASNDDSEPPPFTGGVTHVDVAKPASFSDRVSSDDSEPPAFTSDASNDDEEPPQFPGEASKDDSEPPPFTGSVTHVGVANPASFSDRVSNDDPEPPGFTDDASNDGEETTKISDEASKDDSEPPFLGGVTHIDVAKPASSLGAGDDVLKPILFPVEESDDFEPATVTSETNDDNGPASFPDRVSNDDSEPPAFTVGVTHDDASKPIILSEEENESTPATASRGADDGNKPVTDDDDSEPPPFPSSINDDESLPKEGSGDSQSPSTDETTDQIIDDTTPISMDASLKTFDGDIKPDPSEGMSEKETTTTPRPQTSSRPASGPSPATLSRPVPKLGLLFAPFLQWHVGIYSKTFTPYMQVCGGSLVKPDVVLSAAHCFWNDDVGALRPGLFAVAAGKLLRPWENEGEIYTQYSDIKDIKIPPRFRGGKTNFQDDIAVLLLSTALEYAPGVKPVCVSFDQDVEERHLTSGNLGTIAGWGLSESNGSPSQRLNYVKLPYVDIEECLRTADEGFLKYITSDKICAGDRKTGRALCRGDSGGGLVYYTSTTPYLHGIASTAQRDDNECNAYAVAGFTHVRAHRTFLFTHVPDIGVGCEQLYVNTTGSKQNVSMESSGLSQGLEDRTTTNLTLEQPASMSGGSLIPLTASSNEEPKGVTEETTGVNEEAKGVTEESTGVNEEAKRVTEESTGVNEEAKRVTEESTVVNEEAKGVSEESTVVNEEAKGVTDESTGVNEEVKGVTEESTEVNEEVKGVSEESTGVNEEAKVVTETTGVNEEVKGVTEELKGVTEGSKGVKEESKKDDEESKETSGVNKLNGVNVLNVVKENSNETKDKDNNSCEKEVVMKVESGEKGVARVSIDNNTKIFVCNCYCNK